MIVTPLEMMQARRAQLNQLMGWKNDNNRLGRDQVKIVKDYIYNRMFQNYSMSNAGEFHIEKYIRDYGLVSVLDKVDEAFLAKSSSKATKLPRRAPSISSWPSVLSCVLSKAET